MPTEGRFIYGRKFFFYGRKLFNKFLAQFVDVNNEKRCLG